MENVNLTNRVVEFMLDNPFVGITAKECEQMFGTTECRKIISNIRKMGYTVTDKWVTGKNRYGTITRFKRYYIA